MDTIYSIKNLSKVFKTSKGPLQVLNDVSFEIKQGEIFGIIGLSGAGKSTLIRCLNMIEKPTSGDIDFDGRNLTKLKERELAKIRQGIGMIFQQFNLFRQKTVLKNVYFPLEVARNKNDETKAKARELLELVGLSEKTNEYPATLSGGQKQRVAIARAIVNQPKVLLCDEPTSALDPETTQEILRLLREINQKFGITVIIITHEMSVIKETCNSVAVLDAGKLVEIGAVKDVFESPQSEMARKMIYPHKQVEVTFSGNCIRVVFDGESVTEPVISNMILSIKAPVNILFADTKTIEGKIYGQMIIELPEDKEIHSAALMYLRHHNLKHEEVVYNV
ncbi:MAG: ATP-binding cassette domain-containing protein [Firmicutes bacterium]|nr:ATP-binding cassette domain-containing protein [Bacillota bacterium]